MGDEKDLKDEGETLEEFRERLGGARQAHYLPFPRQPIVRPHRSPVGAIHRGARGRRALVDRRVEPVNNEHVKSAGCLGGSVVSKPNDQRIGVGDGRFAKAEAGANLSTESFCRALLQT